MKAIHVPKFIIILDDDWDITDEARQELMKQLYKVAERYIKKAEMIVETTKGQTEIVVNEYPRETTVIPVDYDKIITVEDIKDAKYYI